MYCLNVGRTVSMVAEVSRHDDEGTGVFSMKLGDGVYGAAGRCWVCRGRNVQDNDDDMRNLSRQMVWTESNSQQVNIRVSHHGEGCPVLGFCLVKFMFYFESNSPLVSGHLPFLLCPWSEVIPNP